MRIEYRDGQPVYRGQFLAVVLAVFGVATAASFLMFAGAVWVAIAFLQWIGAL